MIYTTPEGWISTFKVHGFRGSFGELVFVESESLNRPRTLQSLLKVRFFVSGNQKSLNRYIVP